MGDGPTFRGYRALEDVVNRMAPLAEWTKKFKPDQRHLTLERKDYDLIRRWPKAAHVHQIEVVGAEIWYHGLELTYDGGPRRYAPKPEQSQADIEELIMKDKARDAILVRNSQSGLVDGHLEVETISGNALCGTGLYLMVPVQNEKAADDILKRLEAA